MIKAKLREEGFEAEIMLPLEAYPDYFVYQGNLYGYKGTEERVGVYQLLSKSVYIDPSVDEPLDWHQF